jgi:hypothetical protein
MVSLQSNSYAGSLQLRLLLTFLGQVKYCEGLYYLISHFPLRLRSNEVNSVWAGATLRELEKMTSFKSEDRYLALVCTRITHASVYLMIPPPLEVRSWLGNKGLKPSSAPRKASSACPTPSSASSPVPSPRPRHPCPSSVDLPHPMHCTLRS